nr:AAA family ATPase [uncultured Blautia sp.]
MHELNIPVGISDFEKIRQNNYYYIDKTGLISQLMKNSFAEVTLITRPHRFGKTLAMSMLENFFDIRRDSKEIFTGLEISEDTSFCRKWMNQWPVASLSFRQVDGLNFESAYEMFTSVIADLFQKHSYVLNSDKLSNFDKTQFTRYIQRTASLTETKNSLTFLTRILNSYYGKPVILLIDEYDVPVAKSNTHGYYREMLDLMKGVMQALKDNIFLRFAIITGCLKIAKESIFTGTNNFVSDTISYSRLNEYFGFSQDDVDRLLKDSDCMEKTDSFKAWYDGYHFGDFDVYCPWDVMNYIRDLQYDSNARPSSYWKNTSDNAIIRSFIDYAGSNITKKLENLLSGGYIIQMIDEDLTYDYLHSSEDNLWSILYLTGYLTRVRDRDLDAPLPDKMTALMIPNEEIREIFESTIIKWFDDTVSTWNRQALFDAVWTADNETLTREMTRLLRQTISYHDYREDFYHAFLAGIFAGAGYMVESNKEHGEDRSDVIVHDSVNDRVAIFEAKYSRSLNVMDSDCRKALQQINEKLYSKEFEDDYDEILCYGISFFKKRCLVRKK